MVVRGIVVVEVRVLLLVVLVADADILGCGVFNAV